MNFETRQSGTNVIAFEPRRATIDYWTIATCRGATAPRNTANDNYAPARFEGAQTSDLLLEFLQNVTLQA